MRLSGFLLVCLCVTSTLGIGCGPEPTAKQPDTSASATSAGGSAPSPSASASATAPEGSSAPGGSSGSTPTPAMSASAAASSGRSTSGSGTLPLVGTLTNAEIQQAVNDNLAAFDACYTLGADKQGKLEGTVTVKATVGPLGHVIDVAVVKSTIKNAKVNDCVGAAFKKVVFPHPKGGVAIVTYPMTFGGEVVVKNVGKKK